MPDGGQCLATTLHFSGTGHKTAFKHFSLACQVFTWPMPPALKPAKMFEAHVCHLGAHELERAAIKFNLEPAAWLDIGLAHWIEKDVMKEQSTFCFHEVNASGKNRWQTGKWKKMIYAVVRKRSAAKFANISRRDTDNIDHRAHVHCWSYVDFMIKKHPQKFQKFFQEIKRTANTKKALDNQFQWSTSAFHDAWRKYVIREYDPK